MSRRDGSALLNVLDVAEGECRRQGVGPDRVVLLLRAYAAALDLSVRGGEHTFPSYDDALWLAAVLEPDSKGRLRSTPVVFSSGWAADWSVLPVAVPRLFEALDWDTNAYEWTKAFLELHPFIDGNGRTAWLLYNWINRSLDEPEVLPRFDFAGSSA